MTMNCSKCGQLLPRESAFQEAFRKAEGLRTKSWKDIEEKYPCLIRQYGEFRKDVIDEIIEATRPELMSPGCGGAINIMIALKEQTQRTQ